MDFLAIIDGQLVLETQTGKVEGVDAIRDYIGERFEADSDYEFNCSSSIDFAEEETTDAEVIAFCEKVRGPLEMVEPAPEPTAEEPKAVAIATEKMAARAPHDRLYEIRDENGNLAGYMDLPLARRIYGPLVVDETPIGGELRLSDVDMRTTEAYRQGQRDAEQGWISAPDRWKYTGFDAVAYTLGHQEPRK